jgi:predicted alpha/beta-fold hydrolase
MTMSIQTRLCAFKPPTRNDCTACSSLPDAESDLALILVHGVAMNFYLPPLATFGQELAKRGFHSFVINTAATIDRPGRQPDQIRRLGL